MHGQPLNGKPIAHTSLRSSCATASNACRCYCNDAPVMLTERLEAYSVSKAPSNTFGALSLSSGKQVLALLSHVTNAALVAQKLPKGFLVGGLSNEDVIEVMQHLHDISSPILEHLAFHSVPEQSAVPRQIEPPPMPQASLAGTELESALAVALQEMSGHFQA